MEEASFRLSNAKRNEELSNLRQKNLDRAYVKMNRTKALIDRREATQREKELFSKDNLAMM